MAMGLMNLAYVIFGYFCISVEVFLRRDFGERYLGIFNLQAGYLVVFIFAGINPLLVPYGNGSALIGILSPAFIGMAIYHRYVIWRRLKKGEIWHSYYRGTPLGYWSLLPISASYETIEKWLEPALLGIITVLLSKVDMLASIWLGFSTFSLFVHTHVDYYNLRQSILDMQDSQIQSAYMDQALQGKSPHDTKGFVIPESGATLIRNVARAAPKAFAESQPNVASALSNIDPEFKDLLDDFIPDEPAANSGRVTEVPVPLEAVVPESNTIDDAFSALSPEMRAMMEPPPTPNDEPDRQG